MSRFAIPQTPANSIMNLREIFAFVKIEDLGRHIKHQYWESIGGSGWIRTTDLTLIRGAL